MEFDSRLAESVHEYQATAPRLTTFFNALTQTGSNTAVLIAALAIALPLVFFRQEALALLVLLTMLSGLLIEEPLKQLFQRPRPPFSGDNNQTWSFPSSHSMRAAIVCSLLIYVCISKLRRPKLAGAIALALAILAALIGFSRLYLGKHYLTDVLGGFAFGIGWCTAWMAALAAIRRGRTEPAVTSGT